MQAPIYATRPLEAPPLQAPTARAHEEDLTNKVRRRNQIIPMLMEGEDLHSFGVSPQDAQMLEVRRWCLLRIATAFGLGPEDVGLASPTPDSAGRFYNDVLPPYCADFTRMLNQRLLVEVFDWRAGTYEFDLDEKTGWSQLPNLISATGRPIMTTNEGRAKLNLPPQKDGDELVTPGNVAVGGKPSVGAMPPQDPNKPAQDGSYRTDQGPTPLPSGANGQRNDRQSSGQIAAGKTAEPEEKRRSGIFQFESYQSRRDRAKARQDRNVRRLEKTVSNYLTGLEPQLKASPQTKSTSRKAVADWERRANDFGRLLFRAIRDIVLSEGSYTARQLGSVFSLDETTKYRKAMATGSAQSILDTIRQEIDDNGVDWVLGRFSQHAASAGGSLGARATVWARREAGRQSGQANLQETWVKDTERHAHLDGTSVPLGETWEGGLIPGNSPGCRCTSFVA